jgi:hypothetical protein
MRCQVVAESNQWRFVPGGWLPARGPGATTVHKEGNLAKTLKIESICKASRRYRLFCRSASGNGILNGAFACPSLRRNLDGLIAGVVLRQARQKH